jgi:hypothetical protein
LADALIPRRAGSGSLAEKTPYRSSWQYALVFIICVVFSLISQAILLSGPEEADKDQINGEN